VDMHTTFQQELVKLRLATAKAYMKVMTDGQVSLPHKSACLLLIRQHKKRLRLSALVEEQPEDEVQWASLRASDMLKLDRVI